MLNLRTIHECNIIQILRGLICKYRAKFENGGQVEKMDFLHIYVIDGALPKHNMYEIFFKKK